MRQGIRMAGKQEAFSADENRVLRAALRKLREDRGLSQAEVGDILGIKQQNAGRLLGASTEVGMGRGTANNLARALGFRDAEHFLLEAGVIAALTEPTEASGRWSDRDVAVHLAERLGYDERAIRAVVARYVDDEARSRPVKWWLQRIGLVELELTADRLAPPSPAPRSREAPRKSRST